MQSSKMNATSDRTNDICTPFNTYPLITEEAANIWLHTPIEQILYIIILPIIVIFGLVGNSAFLLMVAKLDRMKTALNFFLVNLAIADIVFLTNQFWYHMVMFYLTPVSYRFPYDNSMSCIIIHLIGYFSHYTSVVIITTIAVERFYAICHPLFHHQMQGKKRALRVMAFTYFVSTALTLITLLKRMTLVEFCLGWPDTERYRDLPSVFRYCGPLNGKSEIATALNIIYFIFFFVVALVNGVLYAMIIFALGSRRPLVKSNSADKNTSVRNQVARALVINGILFFVTQLPMRINDINEILEHLGEPEFLSPPQQRDSLAISGTFLFINSALNPYVYAFISENYRQGFKETFSCLTLRSNNGSSAATISGRTQL